jgi:hypothetical protein
VPVQRLFTTKPGRVRPWLASIVALTCGAGLALMAADDNRDFVWSLEDHSFVSLRTGFLTLVAGIAAGLALGGIVRTLAWLLLATLALWTVFWPWYWSFDNELRPLQRLTLADGRTVTAYHVATPAFARDFCAVRVEERTWFGVWRIHYLARQPTCRAVSMQPVDANRVRVHFVPCDERMVPQDVVVAIPR